VGLHLENNMLSGSYASPQRGLPNILSWSLKTKQSIHKSPLTLHYRSILRHVLHFSERSTHEREPLHSVFGLSFLSFASIRLGLLTIWCRKIRTIRLREAKGDSAIDHKSESTFFVRCACQRFLQVHASRSSQPRSDTEITATSLENSKLLD
jgi:hypothetical protein